MGRDEDFGTLLGGMIMSIGFFGLISIQLHHS